MQVLEGKGGGGSRYLSGTNPTSVSQPSMSKAGPKGGGRCEGDITPTCATWAPPPSGATSWTPAPSGAISSTLACVHDLQEFQKSDNRFKSDTESLCQFRRQDMSSDIVSAPLNDCSRRRHVTGTIESCCSFEEAPKHQTASSQILFATDAWACYINNYATLRHKHVHVQTTTSKITLHFLGTAWQQEVVTTGT